MTLLAGQIKNSPPLICTQFNMEPMGVDYNSLIRLEMKDVLFEKNIKGRNGLKRVN
jgi:hypothetical protein